jgi:hypothetical protein
MTRHATWAYEPGHSISLHADGIVLANYVFAPRDAAKPYVHPIHTLSGVPMTAYQPSDHVWHRGLWFAWKYINGVNYWEETVRPEEGGRQFSDGRTTPVGRETLAFRDGAAVVDHAISYTAPDGAETLHEDRRVTIYPPGDDGACRMDFAHVFTASQTEVTLDVTTVTPESPWGGYAGLGIRTARSLQKFRALSSEGLEGDKANGSRSRWADLSGVADGGVGRSAGVTILAHPQNPRFPSPTYVYHRAEVFGYLNLNPIRDEPMVLPARGQLRLAYRVVIHDGDANPPAHDAEHAAYGSTDPFDDPAHRNGKD